MTEPQTSRNRALSVQRHAEILQRLAANGAVSIANLAEHFAVSRETIRRDLKLLADRKELNLIHGGAARFAGSEPALTQRSMENAKGKAAIGRAAAALVRDGMVVLLDSGTTTLAIAEALTARRSLTVCTPSLAIALRLCRQPGFRVYVLGGEVDPSEEAASGIDMVEALRNLRVDIAFIGAGGLSDTGEVTDFTRNGAEQRSRMIEAAATAYFALDSDKFGRLTPMRVPNFESADGIIVDKMPPRRLAEAVAKRGPRILAGN